MLPLVAVMERVQPTATGCATIRQAHVPEHAVKFNGEMKYWKKDTRQVWCDKEPIAPLLPTASTFELDASQTGLRAWARTNVARAGEKEVPAGQEGNWSNTWASFQL